MVAAKSFFYFIGKTASVIWFEATITQSNTKIAGKYPIDSNIGAEAPAKLDHGDGQITSERFEKKADLCRPSDHN
jgi:hypothetical protein